jgi:hypothetical protein
MKHKLLLFLAILSGGFVHAQSVDEILAKYFQAIGGNDKLKSVLSVKMVAKMNQQGVEIPIEIVQMKDGRQMTKITFQGKEIKQEVYDGSTLWSVNFINMKAEKSDAESTENFKANLGGDFPIPFFAYKDHGYKAELIGKETVEGTETFKVKLTKKPIKVDGKPVDKIEFYYFDTENYVPIMVESEISNGQMKGKIGQTKLSDYQEVNGLMFPFSMTQGIKDMGSQPITMTKIEVDPKVDASVFAFPTGN